MGETNAELARRGFEAARRGDLETIAGMLAPDVRWHGGDPSAPEACRDRKEALEVMRRAGGEDGLGELVDVVEAGEKVVVIMRPASAENGEPGGLVANLTTFRDGKAIEMVHYPNPEDALAAAGF
jgi:ketosteroid isomerase-like protein